MKIEGQTTDLLYREEIFIKSSQDNKDYKVVVTALLGFPLDVNSIIKNQICFIYVPVF